MPESYVLSLTIPRKANDGQHRVWKLYCVNSTNKRLVAAALLTGLLIAQKPFGEYIPMESADSEAALPADYPMPAELVLGRLIYPSSGRSKPSRAVGHPWSLLWPKDTEAGRAEERRARYLQTNSIGFWMA